MKKTVLLLFIAIPILSSAQFEMKYSYVFNSPQNSMRTSLSNAHGFSMDWYNAVKKSDYYVGMGFQVGVYGYHSEPIDFTATDGSVVSTKMNVTNSFNSWSLYHKYRFSKFGNSGRLVPFVDAKTGWSFFRTGLYIQDPNDISNCEPLEQDIMQKDNTWSLYGGAGFDLKMSGLFHSERADSPLQSYFSFSVGFNYGGKVSYMNVNQDSDNTSSSHNHGSGTNGDKTEYYTTWVNTQTQVVHEHHTGYLYTSPIRMLEMKAGFTLRF